MSTGFLITTLTGKLRRLSEVINQHVLQKLYIYVSVSKNQSAIKNIDWVSRRVVDMYSSSFHLYPNLDVRIILSGIKNIGEVPNIWEYNVDVIILPNNLKEEHTSSLNEYIKNMYVIYIDGFLDDEDQTKDGSKVGISNVMYKNVILGGTFDRLHTGHKILLTEALLRCSSKIVVGVTAGDMIKGKKLWELIEPCDDRMAAVQNFINDVDKTVTFNVISIYDMFGPTKTDPDLSMLVVSSETAGGGNKVNELRRKKNLEELKIHVVRLAQDFKRKAVDEEEKISSSNLRMRLLGTYIKIPEAKCDLPPGPYVIGLTGGVASGKSTICEHLESLGAATIDCDKIAHELYRCGTPIYFELVHIFGNEIILEDGEINKKVLGNIVFKDKTKLETLNNLLWPSIIQEAKNQCDQIYDSEGKEIVVIEAAVLLKAGWQTSVHEVWGTIIPKDVAIQRLMSRNHLTQEEAISRIESQSSNTEIVENSNVIFCSLWSPECTKSQVNRAWFALKALRKKIICP